MNKIVFTSIAFIIIFFAYGTYQEINKTNAKSSRIKCQQQSTTFEKISNNKNINISQSQLKAHKFESEASIEYSNFMKSKLINIMNVKELKSLFIKNLPAKSLNNFTDELFIKYYIYENDKKDTNKKNKDALIYEGYLYFEFYLNKELIYTIQSDYLKNNTSSIENRINCIIDSFLSI